jgi:hypothetical protein
LIALTQYPANAGAQTARDLIPLGLEFCVTAAENPDRAAEFARSRGLVDTDPAADTMAFAPGESMPSLMGARVHRQANGEFATECGFEANAAGEVAREEIEALASRFALEVVPGREGRYVLTRRTPHLFVLAYAGPTEAMPCLGEGLEIAPEVLRDHPEIVEEVAEVCNKLGFRMMVQSAYSPTEVLP